MKKSIFKKEIHIVSAVLVISALIYTVYAVNSRQSVAPKSSKAAACKTDECATATGCQLPGFLSDGYKCVGQNQWQSPGGEIVAGGPEGPIPTPAIEPAQDYKAIAKNVLNWIDTLRNEEGVYLNGTCTENEGCSAPVKDAKVVHYAIWARYQNYKNTQNPNQLTEIANDLTNFTKLYDIPGYEISYLVNSLVCSLQYPIATDETIPQEQRMKLEELCQKSVIVGDEIDEADKLIANNNIQEPDIDKVVQDIPLNPDPNTDTENYRKGYFEYAVYASDLATQYLWQQDDRQLKRAKHVFNKALKFYSREKENKMLKNQGDAVLALAAADLFQATQDGKYQRFINKYITVKQSDDCRKTEDCAYYLLMLSKMHKATGDAMYQQEISRVTDKLMILAYDSQVGAFHEMIPGIKIFEARTNSLISGVLSAL